MDFSNEVNVLPPPLETDRGNRLASPSRFELTVLYLLLGAHTVLATDAAIPSGWVTFAEISLGVVAVWLLIRVLLLLKMFRLARPKILRWVECGLLVSVLVGLHSTPMGVAARVYISERQLLEEVQLAQQSQTKQRNGTVVPRGLFSIQNSIRINDQVVLLETVTGSRLFGFNHGIWGGLAYCGQGQPPQFGESYYRHLFGPWWLWLQDV